jgi:hypothetical protein
MIPPFGRLSGLSGVRLSGVPPLFCLGVVCGVGGLICALSENHIKNHEQQFHKCTLSLNWSTISFEKATSLLHRTQNTPWTMCSPGAVLSVYYSKKSFFLIKTGKVAPSYRHDRVRGQFIPRISAR